jgi:hypothetical protein
VSRSILSCLPKLAAISALNHGICSNGVIRLRPAFILLAIGSCVLWVGLAFAVLARFGLRGWLIGLVLAVAFALAWHAASKAQARWALGMALAFYGLLTLVGVWSLLESVKNNFVFAALVLEVLVGLLGFTLTGLAMLRQAGTASPSR